MSLSFLAGIVFGTVTSIPLLMWCVTHTKEKRHAKVKVAQVDHRGSYRGCSEKEDELA